METIWFVLVAWMWWQGDQSSQQQQREWQAQQQLYQPHERLAGALTLGEKRSEEPYSANDLALLGPYWGAPVDYLLVVHTKDSARGAIQRR